VGHFRQTSTFGGNSRIGNIDRCSALSSELLFARFNYSPTRVRVFTLADGSLEKFCRQNLTTEFADRKGRQTPK
jgi:hypothetical protein